MKRAHSSGTGKEEGGEEAVSVLYELPEAVKPDDGGLLDELWIVIFALLDSDHDELANLMLVSKRFRRLAFNNVLWIRQFYRTLAGKGNDRVVFKTRQFVVWLDNFINARTIRDEQETPHVLGKDLCVIPRDNINAARDYVLFHTDASDEGRNDYEKYPNVIRASISMGPPDIDTLRITSGQHLICTVFARLINEAFASIMEALHVSQNVREADENNGYKMTPLFPRFTSETLWCSLFKMCCLDQASEQCDKDSRKILNKIWDEINEIQGLEIGGLAVNGPYIEGHVNDRPLVWPRASLDELRSVDFNHPRCHRCGKYLPFPINRYVRISMEKINPFRRTNGAKFCSSFCLIDTLGDHNDHSTVNCGNAACPNTIMLRHAFGIAAHMYTQKKGASNTIIDGIRHAKTSVSLDVLDKETREDIVLKIVLASNINDHYKSELDQLMRERDNQKSNHDSPSTRYISHLPDSAPYADAQEAYKLNHTVWEKRLATYRLIRGKMEASYIPWSYISNHLPAIDIFFPRPFLSIYQDPANVTPSMNPVVTDNPVNDLVEIVKISDAMVKNTSSRLEVFCSAACKCYSDNIIKFKPTLVHCLNSNCKRVFNIASAALSMECFELTYANQQQRKANVLGETRGYVCDYYCRDAYIDQRLVLLKAAQRQRDVTGSSNRDSPSKSGHAAFIKH